MKYRLLDNWLHIEIDSLFVKTIQDFFDEYIPSKKVQHNLIQNKHILLDGNPCNRNSDIVGINLEILMYHNQGHTIKDTSNMDCEIVYEDEFILIANKPKDLLVHDDGSDEITLVDIVSNKYKDKGYDIYPIHRLDKQTTGLVVFSKSSVFQSKFDLMISNKMIKRSYLAFCKNNIEVGFRQTISLNLLKDRHTNNKMIVNKKGQEAITKIVGLANYKDISIIRCNLVTGKTHQIRCHLSFIGYPILNDDIYGVESKYLKRLGLIADEINLYHPFVEDYIICEAKLPKDMQELYMLANK